MQSAKRCAHFSERNNIFGSLLPEACICICANAEFWFNHTVVEEEGHRNTKGKKNLKTNKVTEGLALESEHMRAEQGLQHGNSHRKEEFKAQPVEFRLCIAGWAPSPPG